MNTPSIDVRILPYYEPGDIDYLFDNPDGTYEKLFVSTFCSRKNVNLDEPTRLAMELPTGAFIAGGFVKSIIANEPVKDYDIFFRDAECLKNMVKRIQNAPETSFLHGYTSEESVRKFADGEGKYMMFTHPTKPALQLVRIRWYGRVEEAIDKFDFTMCQFALDCDLNLTYSSRGLDDARAKRASLLRVAFPLSTGLRLQRFLDRGYSFSGDTYSRDDYLALARRHMRDLTRRAASAGTPAPINADGFGSYES